jgi:hypothetical protein
MESRNAGETVHFASHCPKQADSMFAVELIVSWRSLLILSHKIRAQEQGRC